MINHSIGRLTQRSLKQLRHGYQSSLRLRSGQVWRAIAAGKLGILSRITAAVSTATAIARYGFHGSISLWGLIFMGLTIIFAVAATAVIGSLWAYTVMSSSEYAHLKLDGRGTSEIIQVICREIVGFGLSFNRAVQSITARKDLSTLRPQHIRLMKHHLAKQSRVLDNIAAMLEIAATELHINLHILRDLVFEFNPQLMHISTSKMIDNLETLCHVDPVRRTFLENDIKNHIKSLRRSLTNQHRFLAFPILHSHLIRLITTSSSSQANKHYLRAISAVAEMTYANTPSSGQWTVSDRRKFNSGIRALGFLLRKQQARPGFDLHQACLTACREIFSQSDAQIDGSFRGLMSGKYWQRREALRPLQFLARNLERHIDRGRGEIVDSFRKRYKAWTNQYSSSCPKTILVTHGFSTTVREVLKRGLVMDGENWPLIFIISSGQDTDLDARIMKQALEASKSKCFRDVLIGQVDLLTAFLDNHTKVMLVLGAECFDQMGRIIHPIGCLDVSRSRQQWTEGAGEVCVTIVAEGFKFHDDLLMSPECYRNHLDRVQLYDPSLVDMIITTNSIRNKFQEDNIQDRNHNTSSITIAGKLWNADRHQPRTELDLLTRLSKSG